MQGEMQMLSAMQQQTTRSRSQQIGSQRCAHETQHDSVY
jgi:hypothetical protein